MIQIKPEHIGWLAGIIDGDGNYTIRILKHKTKTMGLRVRFQPQVTIVNTNRDIISCAEKIFDNLNIKYNVSSRQREEKYRRIYQIIVFSTGLRILLPLIKKWCMKWEEVEILEDFLKTNKTRGSGKPYTNDDLLKIEVLRQRLIKLHHVRVPVTRFANEFLLTDDQIEKHKKDRINICRKMRIAHYGHE